MGERDFVRKLMEDEGQLHFWKVAMRPGGPPLFGTWKGTPLFGLPGNPVSSHLVFQLIVAPWIAPEINLFKTVQVKILDSVKAPPTKSVLDGLKSPMKTANWLPEQTPIKAACIHSMVAHNGLTILPPNTDANVGDHIEALWFSQWSPPRRP